MEIETNQNHKLYGVLNLSELGRDRAIRQFIDSRHCFENDIRKEIFDGTYVYRKV